MPSDDALDLVQDNFTGLGDWLDGMGEVIAAFDDTDTMAVRAMLDTLLSQVRGAIGAVDNRLIQLIPAGTAYNVPGLGSVVIETKGKTTNHGEKLARRLAARVADTPADDDGVALPPAILCEKTADELVKVFGLDNPSHTFRSTEVKNRKLRVSEFRDYEDGLPRVRYTP